MKSIKRRMTALACALVLLLSLTAPVMAAPAYPGLRNYKQPDGTGFQGYCVGDEYFAYNTDDQKNLIQQDSADSVWKYVYDEGDTLSLGPAVSQPPDTGRLLSASRFTEQSVKEQYAALAGKSLGTVKTDYERISLEDIPQPLTRSAQKTIPMVAIVIGFDNVDYDDTADWNHQAYYSSCGVTGYYSATSGGQFTFEPAAETSAYGTDNNTNRADQANDGVIHVKVEHTHGDWSDIAEPEKNRDFFKAIYKALDAASVSINFADYDTDGDGILTPQELSIVYVLAGYEASWADESGGEQPSVWAHRSYFYNLDDPDYNKIYHTVQGVELSDYMAIGEHALKNVLTPSTVICHESGHILGLLDYYKTDYALGDWDAYAVNYLSPMDYGGYGYATEEDLYKNNFTSTYMDAFSQSLLGYCTPETITQDGVYTVSTVDSSAGYNTYKIPTMADGEYFLVENRQYENYDMGLKGPYGEYSETGGLVYWHIDENIYDAYEPSNTINNADHRPAVMPVYPETEFNKPSPREPFWNVARSLEYPDLKPLNALYDGDAVTSRLPSGIDIQSSEVGSSTMRFSIKFPKAEIETVALDTTALPKEGGSLLVRLDGRNFYNTITAQLCDGQGSPVKAPGATAVYAADENATLTSAELTLQVPENTSDQEAAYQLRLSLDGGRTFIDTVAASVVNVAPGKEPATPTVTAKPQAEEPAPSVKSGSVATGIEPGGLSTAAIPLLLIAVAAVVGILCKRKGHKV